MDTEIVKLLAQIVPPIVGVFINHLTHDHHNDVVRSISVCNNVILDITNSHFEYISTQLNNELNRVLSIKSSSIDLQNIGMLNPKLELSITKEPIEKLERTYNWKNKFEKYLIFIPVFRWIFYVLLLLGLIYLFFTILDLHFIPNWYVVTVTSISILCIGIFFLFQLLLRNLLNKFTRCYGITF